MEFGVKKWRWKEFYQMGRAGEEDGITGAKGRWMKEKRGRRNAEGGGVGEGKEKGKKKEEKEEEVFPG